MTDSKDLREHVKDTVGDYLANLNDQESNGVYHMVINEVEGPLLESIMEHTSSNQSKAARMLGINRNTLRKKLEQHNLL